MADSTTEDVQQQPEVKQAPPPIRHDWYQTPSDVIVDILAKGVKKEGVAVDFSEKTVSRSHSLIPRFHSTKAGMEAWE